MKKKESQLEKYEHYIEGLLRASLSEDIGSGDITTASIVDEKKRATAKIIAKEPMTVCGLEIASLIFQILGDDSGLKVKLKTHVTEGAQARKGATLATLRGSLRTILTGERVALNYLQHLSGIATLTREFTTKVKGTGVKILDTRKTTPCMRLLEKYAVQTGGGVNHRLGLFDAILIKDNHIKAAGTIGKAIVKAKKAHIGIPIEVETTSLKEVKEAVDCGADIIMLDNMDKVKIKKAIAIIGGLALVEVSGGITLKNIRGAALAGVDFISVGAITHSARSMDITMKVD